MAAKRGGLGINLDSLIPTTLTVNEEVVATHRRKYLKGVKGKLAQYRTHQTPLVVIGQKELQADLNLEENANEPIVYVNRFLFTQTNLLCT